MPKRSVGACAIAAVQAHHKKRCRWRILNDDDARRLRPALTNPAAVSRPRAHHRPARLQPLDGAAGGALRASVHRTGLCLQRLQPADDPAARRFAIGARRLEAHRPRLDLFDRDGVSRTVGRDLRPLGRGRRPAQGDVHRRRVLGQRVPDLGARRLSAQSLDHLSRLRRDRRLRARHRLHLAGLDADEMVSRPSGHGHRHGDHGIRRRRADRLAAVGVADGQVCQRRPMSACSTPSSRSAASISCS